MRILITGANGMLGKALQKELIDHNVIQHTRYVSDLANPQQAYKFYEFVEKVNPDYVVHTASIVGGLNFNNSHSYDFISQNNFINGIALDACVKKNVARFLGILSVCCYGDGFQDNDYPLTEDKLLVNIPHPTNASYAYSKRNLAISINAANKQYDKRYNYLIPTNLYGENDSRGEKSHFCSFMVDKLINAVHNEDDIIDFVGDGNARRQYLYVDDLARIIHRHIELDIDDNYNVTPTDEMSAFEMISILMQNVGQMKEARFANTMTQGQSKRTVSNALMRQYHPDFEFTEFRHGISKVYDKWKKLA